MTEIMKSTERVDICMHMKRLIHADTWQKLTQYCDNCITPIGKYLGLVKVLKMAGWKLALKATLTR